VSAQQQEASAAEIPGDRMHHRERESRCDCRINCVAAGPKNFNARIGSEMMDADDHGVTGANRLFSAPRQSI
jgi:hypothetical protein